MTTKNETECWACHRVIVGKAKMGLCPDCVNKYGTVGAIAGVGVGIGIGGKLLKHGGKIIKNVAQATKIFRG